jgi:hypothetical protein
MWHAQAVNFYPKGRFGWIQRVNPFLWMNAAKDEGAGRRRAVLASRLRLASPARVLRWTGAPATRPSRRTLPTWPRSRDGGRSGQMANLAGTFNAARRCSAIPNPFRAAARSARVSGSS